MAITRVSTPTSVGVDALPIVFEVLPAIARTATPDTMEFDVQEAASFLLVISRTAFAATPQVTVTIRGVMADGTTEYDILSSAVITDASATPVVMEVGPSLAVVANKAANHILPKKVHVVFTHGDADSITYKAEGTLTPA